MQNLAANICADNAAAEDYRPIAWEFIDHTPFLVMCNLMHKYNVRVGNRFITRQDFKGRPNAVAARLGLTLEQLHEFAELASFRIYGHAPQTSVGCVHETQAAQATRAHKHEQHAMQEQAYQNAFILVAEASSHRYEASGIVPPPHLAPVDQANNIGM